jgi:hypothetical protein
MSIETDSNDTSKYTAPAATPLDAFRSEHRLLHRQDELRGFLGTETIEDLDDVHPGDLQTMRAAQWADAVLTVAEANRLARAVRAYHAEKLPPAHFGPQWFPPGGGLPGASTCDSNV